MLELALLVVSITAQSSNVVLRERYFIFLLRVGESIVWSIFAWFWEIRWEWGLGFLSVGSPGSLSTSPFPSYSGLLRPVIIRVSCLSFLHVAMFSILVVFTIFFYTPSSFVLSLFVFFYPRRSLFCFLNGMSSSFYNLSFGIVHLYVDWVTRLTRFSHIWHCALRSLLLSFGYLGLVSHRFIHLLISGLYYGLSHKTTLRPRDLVFTSTYFIWTGSIHWLKYRMLANLHFLRIWRNSIMFSLFGLLASRPWSEINDA